MSNQSELRHHAVGCHLLSDFSTSHAAAETKAAKNVRNLEFRDSVRDVDCRFEMRQSQLLMLILTSIFCGCIMGSKINLSDINVLRVFLAFSAR